MTILNYDASGFIMGINRLNDGVDNVHTDTQEIIRILLSMQQINDTRLKELTRAVRVASQNTRNQNTRSRNRDQADDPGNSDSGSNGDRSRSNNPNRRSNGANNGRNDQRRDNSRDSDNRRRARNRRNLNDDPDLNPGDNDNSSDDAATRRRRAADRNRARDANGRFTRGDGDGDSDSDSRSGGGSGGSLGGNVSGIDPLLDSINEARTLLSPLTRGAGMLGRGVKFSVSKLRAMKRREPLPDDQDRHNNENESLLDKIWKAILKSAGGGGAGGGGILGSLLGSLGLGGAAGAGGGILSKLLKKAGGIKGLGAIGAVLGVGSLAMDWDSLDHKGKSEGVGGLAGAGAGALAGGAAGAAIGSVVPIVGTAIGGIVGSLAGAWIGGNAGEALGAAASPYIKSWTDSLVSYNLPEKMSKFWQKGMRPAISKLLGVSAIQSWADNFRSRINGGGGGGESGGDLTAGVTQKANKAADLITKNALTRSSGYCAKYVRQGLQQAGYDLKTMGDAKNYNNGALTDAGFSKVDPKTDGLQKGDVMVMPAQGKHKAGHIQVYNGKQWVSDFKQNSINPWGDVATENLNATMYRDKRGAMMAGTGGKGSKGKSDKAMQYFMSQGWSKEQAAGIVGNIQKESQFDHTVGTGDSGKAYGLGQWHPDRQANFKKKYGKSIKGSSFEEQLAFIQFELTQGEEQNAGNRLKKARSAGSAGSIVSQFYERPKKVESEKIQRARIAEQISNGYGGVSTTGAQVRQLGLSSLPGAGGLKASFTPAGIGTGYSPAAMPMRPLLDMPKMPSISQRIDSGSDNKPMYVQSSNDTISQNVSDRGLAHAITGGIGKDRYYG